MFETGVSEANRKHSGSAAPAAIAAQRNLATPRMQPSAHGNQALLQLRQSAAREGVIQRTCSCGGKGGDCPECKKKKEETTMRRRSVSGGRTPSAVPSLVQEVLQSPGQPLDRASRAFFEPRFGRSFDDVRVHTGSRAAQSAHAVDAHAYAVGNQVVFGQGKFDPTGHEGRSLLAHELAHVVQQGNVQNVAPSRISNPTDASEREADAAGRASMAALARGTSPISAGSAASGPTLFRLGANPGCNNAESDAIHQAIFNARGWLNKAIPALEVSPLTTGALGALRRNFGPTYGVAANAQLIRDRLAVARGAVGTIPYSCARGPADATCASGFCGYSFPGTHASTICADVTLVPSADAVYRAGCVLHESFHASFSNMTPDFYSGWHGHSSSTAGYPGAGTDPLLNADSYTSLTIDLS